MFNRQLFAIFLFPCIATLAATAEDAMLCSDYKAAIVQYQREIDQLPITARSELQVKIAIAHWRDQEQERAFNAFLAALDTTPSTTPAQPMSKEEDALYREALDFYLAHPGREASNAAAQVRERYEQTVAKHPEYNHLGYLIALAYANGGRFDEFFVRFYPSYRADPDHFLAYKTRALLHHRLMERARDPAQRERERKQAQTNIEKALERFSGDVSLYQMNISLALPNEKTSLVHSALGKITRDPLVVPRSEVLFFIKEAVAVGEWELAEQFLARAHHWYPSSRIVKTAEEYLQERRPGIDKAR